MTRQDRTEGQGEPLDARRREELQRATTETAARLRDRGVQLTGRESGEELVSLLEAVERFERAVEAQGGDLMVDEGPRGETAEPDDVHFVIPRRGVHESVAEYLERIDGATRAVRRHRPHDV